MRKLWRWLVILLAGCGWQNSQVAHLNSNDLGINIGNTAGNTDLILELPSRTGVGWVRLDAKWDQLEPKKGKYDWYHNFHRDYMAARDAGLKVFVTVSGFPEWDWTYDDLTEFVSKMAPLYIPDAISFWNEPNGTEYGIPGGFTAWLDYYHAGVSAAGEYGIAVVAGELAGNERNAERWIQRIQLSHLTYDALSIHWYGHPSGLAEMLKRTKPSTPVWITETGHSRDQSESQQLRQFKQITALPYWDKVFPYHWYTDGNFAIRGTKLEAYLRDATQ